MLHLEAPDGAVWQFFLLFAVVFAAPWLVERVHVPGIVGLLLGGFAIGPHGLNLITAAEPTVPDLGQLGLLYLMFLAGLELDLGLLRAYRRSALVFAAITFTLPFAGGVVLGIVLGWAVPAALLLGALLSSHTLVTYPLIRERGLGVDPAVATAVGATIITDTLALVILAAVSRTEEGAGSPLMIGVQLALGLAVAVGVAVLVLPRLVRWGSRRLGTRRPARYALVVAAMLGAAVLADTLGIESIVGAFFAGLALNRLVPNQGPLMERVQFFGSAVLIPVFVVAVGFILDPRVLAEPATLGLAGLLIVVCLGGKSLAALLTRPLMRFSAPQAGIAFALTSPQAAATLAATTVGFRIGLFGTSVVNAVLVLILVSLIVSPLAAVRFTARIRRPSDDDAPLGARVLVAVRQADADPDPQMLLRMAARIAETDGGVVFPILVRHDDDPPHEPGALDALDARAAAAGIDGDSAVVVDRSLPHAVLHAAAARRATLVLVAEPAAAQPALFATWSEAVAAATPAPVAMVRGSGRMRRVVLAAAPDVPVPARVLAAELAHRLAAGTGPLADGPPDPAVGDLLVVPTGGWGEPDGTTLVPDGAVVVRVPPPRLPEVLDDDPLADGPLNPVPT